MHNNETLYNPFIFHYNQSTPFLLHWCVKPKFLYNYGTKTHLPENSFFCSCCSIVFRLSTVPHPSKGVNKAFPLFLVVKTQVSSVAKNPKSFTNFLHNLRLVSGCQLCVLRAECLLLLRKVISPFFCFSNPQSVVQNTASFHRSDKILLRQLF
jgi:hypothetical protein